MLLTDTDALIDELPTVTECVLIVAKLFLDPNMTNSVLLLFSFSQFAAIHCLKDSSLWSETSSSSMLKGI